MIFTLPEENLAAVNTALAAGTVNVTTLSQDGSAELDEGTLTLVDNVIDQTTGTAKLKATFKNAHNKLWPGQYVNARVLVRTDRDAMTLPTAAVQLGPNGPFTYVVKGDSTVEVRPLKISDESHGMTIVTSGTGIERAGRDQQSIPPAAGRPCARERRAGFRRRRPGGSASVMSISEPFVRRPIATSLLMGGSSCSVWSSSPCCQWPLCRRSTSPPFRSPPICRAAARKPWPRRWPRRWNINSRDSGLAQMTSTNVLGSTQITLQFDLNRNIDAAAQDVQTGIDAAGGQLPKNLPSPPTYRKVNPADAPILILAVHSDVLPVTTVDDYAENILAQQISQIPGIAQVTIGGQQKPACGCRSIRSNWPRSGCRWRTSPRSSPPPPSMRRRDPSMVRNAA